MTPTLSYGMPRARVDGTPIVSPLTDPINRNVNARKATIIKIEEGNHPTQTRVTLRDEFGYESVYSAMWFDSDTCKVGNPFELKYEWNGAGYSYLPYPVRPTLSEIKERAERGAYITERIQDPHVQRILAGYAAYEKKLAALDEAEQI